MKIERVETAMVFVPFRTPHLWGSGRRPGATRLVLQVHTDAGIVGLGETICLLEFVRPVLEQTVVPLAIGEDPHDVERIYRMVEGAGYYHHKRAMVAALCGLEMACWDIVGKAAGQPLHKLWGGRYRDRVPTISYLHVKAPEQMAREAVAAVEQGHRTIKAKIGLDMASDIAIVKAIREAIGPDVALRGDVNGAWTPGTARRQLAKLEKYDLEFVEQPLVHDDLLGHAALRRVTSVPIALDEGCYTQTDVLNAIRAEAADVILLDPHESAGLWTARKSAAIAEAAGMPVGLHSGSELGISEAAYLHLAAATPNMSVAIDTGYPGLVDDVITERHRFSEGSLPVPTGPGLGVTLDSEKLAHYRTDRIVDAYGDRERPGWFTEKPAY
ncbi:MAG: mandelate racemase/muconate lactonizing enzyme family protein [Chloroflexi bacterium]|nr:mandelate racemase/muconate lactonizing enzyme family protein [Chloroflexota bacterium]